MHEGVRRLRGTKLAHPLPEKDCECSHIPIHDGTSYEESRVISRVGEIGTNWHAVGTNS